VVVKNYVFWDAKPSSSLKVKRSFWGTYRFHLLGRIVEQAGNQHVLSRKQSSATRRYILDYRVFTIIIL
jgi:hypothetical protein